MTQEKKTQEELWKKATQETKYFKFKEDERVTVGFHNWKLTQKQVPDFNDKNIMVDGIEFSCLLFTKEDDTTKEYEFTTLSKRLMAAVHKHLKDKEPTDIVFLRIKQIGKGNGVQYDVETVEDAKDGY